MLVRIIEYTLAVIERFHIAIVIDDDECHLKRYHIVGFPHLFKLEYNEDYNLDVSKNYMGVIIDSFNSEASFEKLDMAIRSIEVPCNSPKQIKKKGPFDGLVIRIGKTGVTKFSVPSKTYKLNKLL